MDVSGGGLTVEREHLFATDPEATSLLSEAVRRLSQALGGPGQAEAVRDANELIARLGTDGNPRVRAQVRALAHVLQLLESGDADDAAELLTGELARSFPGEGDLSAAEKYLSGPEEGSVPE
jgi:hypothetical protein